MDEKKNATFSIITFLFFTILLGAFSCPQKHSFSKQFYIAESLMDQHPDSALKIMVDFNDTDYLSEKEKSDYYLLLTEAKDKNYITHTSDSLINTAVKYYEEGTDPVIKAKSYYYQGRVYHDMQRLAEAALCYKKAANEVEKTTSHRLKSLIYNNYGLLCLYQDLYNEAELMYKKSYYTMLQQAHDTCASAYILLDICHVYLIKNEYNLALNHYKEALAIATTYNEREMQSAILYDIGLFYDNMGMIDSAVYYIQESLFYNSDIVSMDEVSLGMADIYRKAGLKDSALVLLKKCLISENLYTKTSAYKCLSKIKETEGNISQAFKLHKIYTHYKDSITKKSNTVSLAEVIAKYDNEKLQNENSQIILEKTQARSNLYSLLFICLFLGIITSRAFIFYRKKKEHKEKEHLNRIDILQKQIMENKRQFNVHENSIRLKTKLLKDANIELKNRKIQLNRLDQEKEEIFRIQKEMEQLEKSRNDLKNQITNLRKKKEQITTINDKIISQASLIDRLKLFKTGNPIPETEWIHLSDLMNEHYNNFTKRLVIKYPNLKQHDILICNLTKIGLPIETIAYLNHSKYESILTKRSRIKQRMQNKGNQTLEDILNNLE